VLNAGVGGASSIGTTGALLALLGTARTGALVALASGVLIFTGEVQRGSLTATLLHAPRRGRLLAVKAITAASFGLVMGLADVVAVVVVGHVSGALDPGLVNVDIVLRAVGLLAAYPLYGVLGVGVGALLHHQALAVVLPVAWYLFLEDLLIPADSALRPWTLGDVSAALANAGDVARLMPIWGGALVLVGFAGVAMALGTSRLVRRDVT
jgi:hypothetical protein